MRTMMSKFFAAVLVVIASGGCTTMTPPSGAIPVKHVTEEMLEGTWKGTYTISRVGVQSSSSPFVVSIENGVAHWVPLRRDWRGSEGIMPIHDGVAWKCFGLTEYSSCTPVRVSETPTEYFMEGGWPNRSAHGYPSTGSFLIRKPKTSNEMARSQ